MPERFGVGYQQRRTEVEPALHLPEQIDTADLVAAVDETID
jgi:hypothetical protein